MKRAICLLAAALLLAGYRLGDSLAQDAPPSITPATVPASPPAPATPLTIELSAGGPALAAIPGDEHAQASRKTRAALEKRAADFSVAAQPLHKVLASLWDSAGVPASVDWGALEAAGLTKDTPITLKLKDVPWSKVLAMTLDQAGHGAATLDYLIDEGTVEVSTADLLRSSKFAGTRAYDIGFLLWDHDTLKADVNPVASELVNLIETTITPDSWRDAGGSIGACKVLGRTLFVTHTARAQRQVEALLETLKASGGVCVRVYDIRDLALGAGDAKVVSVASATLPADRGGRVKQLIDTIESTVARDSWRDRGGTTSSLSEFDGKLYVTTTAGIHKQIEEVLRLMRGKPEPVGTAAK